MTKAEIAATIRANIARMETALATDKPGAMVYCWPAYGLGVSFKGSDIAVTSIERATIVRKPDGRTFKNGAGVQAALIPRAVALERAISETRATLACFA